MHEGKEYAKIGDRLYTEHAVSRMLPSSLGRYASVTAHTKEGMSISPTFIEHVIKNGVQKKVTLSSGVERIIYSSGSIKVYTEQGGKIVVTVNALRGMK
jgi:filamentous hemagglutinin